MSDTPTIPASTTPAPAAAPKTVKDNSGYFWGTGRRKTAVARVRIKPGSGKFIVDKRDVEAYFFQVRDRTDAVAPLKATNTLGKWDIAATVFGGGQTGQAQAIMLGVARALMKADPSLEASLRDGKFLTRDSREVERKKYGRPGARKRFQFSKR